jgi:hypothetical protein
MNRKGKASPRPPKEIVRKVRDVIAELEESLENDGLTTPQLIKFVQRQTSELARIHHQLCNPHSEKEGNR